MTEDEHTSQGREPRYELLADFTHPDGRVDSIYYRAEERQETLHAPNAISSVHDLGDLLNGLYVPLHKSEKNTQILSFLCTSTARKIGEAACGRVGAGP